MSQTISTHDRFLSQAAQALRGNQLVEAIGFARQALDAERASVSAKFVLGMAYARNRDAPKAIEMLQQVLEADPKSYETLVSLSTLYRESGSIPDAVALGIRAAEIHPNEAHAHNQLGLCFLAGRNLEQAAAAFSRAIDLQPRFAAAYLNLGKVRQLEGKDGDAANAFARAAVLAPTLDNLLAFCQGLLTLGDFDGALECARKCAESFPSSAAAHLILCGALTEQNQFAEAENQLQKAIELDKDRSESLAIAIRQRPLGHLELANDYLRHAIKNNPRLVSAYSALIQNHKLTESDKELADRLNALLEEPLASTERISIHYSLGKALEDFGNFQESMRHYDEANRQTLELKFGNARFDEHQYARHIDQMIRSFTPEQKIDEISDSELPILIVGMMRSGTTLVEQILSSHPATKGAGEQLFWSRNWRRTLASGSERPDGEIVARLGHEYVEALKKIGPNASRVTDKMPGNYMFAGLIHQALPNAKIIHIRRNPVDNCLSIWATPNHMPHEGNHEKHTLTFVYKQYMRLMNHWRSVLPPDRFLEIDYEQLVSECESVARTMVDYCGLEWHDACLRPEENKRTVLTPSAWQVRQPVYKTSVERWRKFEPYLGQFTDLMGLEHPSKNELGS